MNKAMFTVLGLFLALTVAATPLATLAARPTPQEIAAQREAKRQAVKKQKEQIREQRAEQAKQRQLTAKAKAKARQQAKADQTIEQKQDAAPSTDAAKFVVPAGTVYKNSAMGFEFANSLWLGYVQYAAVYKNYPELTWFDNIVGYNLPIYLNEKGFTLDEGQNNYFTWDNFSDEWKLFYRQHFSMKRQGELVYIKFDLPTSVLTADYGAITSGTWYFTSTKGLMSEKDFKKANTTSVELTIEEKAKDAKRVFESALAVQKALDAYHTDTLGYPIAFERPFELGENGLTALYRDNAFHGQPENNKAYITNIQSGRPSTKIMYDSRYGGQGYAITFTIYGQYDQYEPGVYSVEPYIIRKIADLK